MNHVASGSRPRFGRRALGVLVFAGSASCTDTFRALGPNPAAADAHAAQLVGALAARYAPNERDARYNVARTKLTTSALVPSRIWNDTAVWAEVPGASIRALYIQGSTVGEHYRLETRPALGPAVAPGDSRHAITLQRLDESSYRWDTNVGFALGSVTADEVGAAFDALLSAASARGESDLRADYRAAFPRAAAAFGRGFSIDSVRLAPGGPGLTSVNLTIVFHPERLAASYPAFTAYLDNYLGPAKYRFTLLDRSGATMFEIVGRDRAMTMRYRVARTGLVALSGVPLPLGDTLQLQADATIKVKMFTVGFHGLVSEFVITRAPHERAWSVVSQREPNWVLPLATKHLIRSSLRRPFDGAGSLLRLSVRDTAGGQTMFVRRTRLDVQESTLMRFIGSLGARLLGDISPAVEAEEFRFLREGFVALAADGHALATRPGRTEIENAIER